MKRKILFPLIFLMAFSVFWQKISADESPYNIVYLATYPRSGNHWMRHLIEEATHVATGSVYRDMDPPHLPQPFPWGGFACQGGYGGNCKLPEEGDIVVLKTHYPAHWAVVFDNKPHHVTVRIIRHPVDSIYSYYTFLKGPQTDPIPKKSLKNFYIKSWGNFQRYWEREKNVYTIRYEDLFNNPKLYLKRVLQVIGYHVTDADIERAVEKHPPQGGLLKHIQKFSKDDLEIIESRLGPYLDKYGYTIDSVLYPKNLDEQLNR